jgi:xylulokinase
MPRYLLGFDVGSSTIKAALIDIGSEKAVARSQWPEKDMGFVSIAAGFAEQNPDDWWNCIRKCTGILLQQNPQMSDEIAAIGISYQMHGLVALDSSMNLLRPAVIWCDSRAVEIGERALEDLGKRYCLNHFLNSPGNFTASKLRWVKENEPDIFDKIHTIMLPGDYVAFRMTGELYTTRSGLSEGILWDFQEGGIARRILSHYEIPQSMIPKIKDNFSRQGKLTKLAAQDLGLKSGIPITYRAGDLATNAFSLNVVSPGDVAAKIGMSGTIYGISQRPICDTRFRLNTFVHVNHTKINPSYGILHCVNGAGILNHWLCENLLPKDISNTEIINSYASRVKPGSEGVLVYPFGNGSERSLGNLNMGMAVHGIDFAKHSVEHIVRGSQEGIAFALNYGIEIMRDIGVEVRRVRAMNSNLFQSNEFCEAFAAITQTQLEVYNTDAAEGTARAAGIGAGIYSDSDEAFRHVEMAKVYNPDKELSAVYSKTWEKWKSLLSKYLETS